MVGVDCEMVKTEKGLELARLTLGACVASGRAGALRSPTLGLLAEGRCAVDDKRVVLYDALIRPANPILDYCTQARCTRLCAQPASRC
jgi:hypothetical protein